MKVAVSGSSGFIGSHLLPRLESAGHQTVRLVRPGAPSGPDTIRYDTDSGAIEADRLRGVDAVIHLAGVGIGDKRWNEKHKKQVLESRVRGTSLIAKTIADLDGGPSVLLSSSAVGYYGLRGDETLSEESSTGSGFLAAVCKAWEESTSAAHEAGKRVVRMRSGTIVLSPAGGALQRQLIPFRFGVGGRLGSGRQYWSWIALDDEIEAILFLLEHDDASGPINLTAPNPVTNQEFTDVLGRVLHRPTFFSVPPLALRTLLGPQMADELLLGGQKVLPERLLTLGYDFLHTDLEEALTHLLRGE